MSNTNNNPNDDHNGGTPHDDPAEVRAAFDRLASDAAKVNTMNALQQHDDKKAKVAWWNSPGVLVGSVAAALLLVVGSLWAINRDGDDSAEENISTSTPTPDTLSPTPTPGEGDGGEAVGYQGSWVLVAGSIGSETIDANAGTMDITLEGDQVFGTAACNGYGGSYEVNGTSITFSDLSQTEMGCEAPLMALEQQFMAALAETTTIEVVEGFLRLSGGDSVLEFSPLAPAATAELVGTTWLLDTLISGDTASSTINGADPAFLQFNADGTFVGHTGCRSFSGEWVETGATITITNMTMEGECPSDFQSQDGSVVSVLEDFSFEIDGGRLTLMSGADGLSYTVTDGVPTAPTPTPEPVEDIDVSGDWVLTGGTVDGSSLGIQANTPALTLVLGTDGSLSGSDGCNTFQSGYEIDGDSFTVGVLASTLIGCTGPLGDLSNQFNQGFAVVDTAAIENGNLVLTGPATRLVYRSGVPDTTGDDDVAVETTFDDFACGETGPDTEVGTNANILGGTAYYDSGTCRRSVLYMEAIEGGNVTVSPSGVSTALPYGGGVNITVGSGLTINYELLADNPSIVLQAHDGNSVNKYLHVNHGQGTTSVTTLNNPARIVVDTVVTPGGTSPIYGNAVQLPRPLNEGGPGRTMPMTVTGLGIPFEATGSLSLRQAPGVGEAPGSGPLVDADWSGTSFAGPTTDNRYVYTTGSIDGFGEFSFTIDGLAPGEYELLFEAFNPEESGTDGLYVTFTVLDDGLGGGGGTTDGLELRFNGIFFPVFGNPEQVSFGGNGAQIEEALSDYLGEVPTSFDLAECPAGPAVSYNYSNGLMLNEIDEQFVGWSVDEPGLTTPELIGVGSTLAQADAAYDLEQFVDSTLGVEYWVTNPADANDIQYTFFLTGTSPTDTIDLIQAGTNCNFR